MTRMSPSYPSATSSRPQVDDAPTSPRFREMYVKFRTSRPPSSPSPARLRNSTAIAARCCVWHSGKLMSIVPPGIDGGDVERDPLLYAFRCEPLDKGQYRLVIATIDVAADVDANFQVLAAG